MISGGAGVVLRYGGTTRTKDVDAVVSDEISLRLEEFAGRGSEVHRRTGTFLEIVRVRYPRPDGVVSRSAKIELMGFPHLEVRVIELHDLIVTKLGRLSAKDRADIRVLANNPAFDHDVLLGRYRTARWEFKGEDRTLAKIDANLNAVRADDRLPPIDWSEDY